MEQLIKIWCEQYNFEFIKDNKLNNRIYIQDKITKIVVWVDKKTYTLHSSHYWIRSRTSGKTYFCNRLRDLYSYLQIGLPMLWGW